MRAKWAEKFAIQMVNIKCRKFAQRIPMCINSSKSARSAQKFVILMLKIVKNGQKHMCMEVLLRKEKKEFLTNY